MPGDDLQRLDALGHQGTGTAQSGQIDRAVADNGLLDSGIPLALADHNFVAQVQQAGAHGIHPAAGGGAGRADELTRALRGGADVVDSAALKVEGERFAPVQCFDHPLVGLIPGGVYHAGEQHGIACPEGGQILGGAGGG